MNCRWRYLCVPCLVAMDCDDGNVENDHDHVEGDDDDDDCNGDGDAGGDGGDKSEDCGIRNDIPDC